jgi:hypothetical protein
MLKVAGSLVTNQVRAYDLLRMFGREGRLTPLGAAFAEYGRIDNTEHLMRMVDPVDATYRRQMNRQLTVQESRHKLARDVCHGKCGTIHQAYRDGMEDQLSALGLVLNAIALWTTRYIDAAVAQLKAEGHEIRDEDIARLSPLKHKNLNLLGRYSFTASTPGRGRAAFAARPGCARAGRRRRHQRLTNGRGRCRRARPRRTLERVSWAGRDDLMPADEKERASLAARRAAIVAAVQRLVPAAGT